jgi:hypothetical protein
MPVYSPPAGPRSVNEGGQRPHARENLAAKKILMLVGSNLVAAGGGRGHVDDTW